MINRAGVEKGHHTTIGALMKFLADNPPKVLAIADLEANAVEGLCRVLLSNCLLELKEETRKPLQNHV